MKPFVTLPLAAFLFGCVAQEPVELSRETRSRLDEAVAGRAAGPPQACVSQRDLRASHTLGEGAVLFEGPGTLIYVNRTSGGCNTDFGRSLVTRTPSNQLCRGDIVRSVEPVSGTDWGSCTLGDFTPYRRVR